MFAFIESFGCSLSLREDRRLLQPGKSSSYSLSYRSLLSHTTDFSFPGSGRRHTLLGFIARHRTSWRNGSTHSGQVSKFSWLMKGSPDNGVQTLAPIASQPPTSPRCLVSVLKHNNISLRSHSNPSLICEEYIVSYILYLSTFEHFRSCFISLVDVYGTWGFQHSPTH